MGQFGPAPFGQRRGVEFVDVDAREIFARQRVVPFVHLVQRLHRVGVLVRPESIRCLVDAALQPDDQIVQARADIGIPLVGGPARLDVAGHKVGLGNQLPQGAAIQIGIRMRSHASRYTNLPSPITVNNGSCLHKAMTVS